MRVPPSLVIAPIDSRSLSARLTLLSVMPVSSAMVSRLGQTTGSACAGFARAHNASSTSPDRAGTAAINGRISSM